MHRNQGPIYYGDYLKLNNLLDCQNPLSLKYGDECHDETLFIIVHQVYELWFKQILKELESVRDIMTASLIEESQLGIILSRLERIKKIQGLLINQLEIIETMSPMDFLEFRDLLIPASGFQSLQFRQIEILMGLTTENREQVDREFFLGRLSEKDRAKIVEAEKKPSLLKCLETWLLRTPFTQNNHWSFWNEYQHAVDKILAEEKKIIERNQANMSEQNLNISLENLRMTKENFASLLDETKYNELKSQGLRKFEQKAALSALFIFLYRDEPILHLPYKILTEILDIDLGFTTWRYRHALMAQKMLGTKIGTGGSSGHAYLKRAADNNKVYQDLFNLSTFLIPRSKLPKLPPELRAKMNFSYDL